MQNSYMGMSLFNEVDSNTLRAWNRINAYVNMKDTHDSETAGDYLKLFKENDLLAINLLIAYIKKKGAPYVKAEMLRMVN